MVGKMGTLSTGPEFFGTTYHKLCFIKMIKEEIVKQ
jgi:hypothetical protein